MERERDLYKMAMKKATSQGPVKTMRYRRQLKVKGIESKSRPEQYDLHQAQMHHCKLKNHKDEYTDPASGSHLYTPISAPYTTNTSPTQKLVQYHYTQNRPTKATTKAIKSEPYLHYASSGLTLTRNKFPHLKKKNRIIKELKSKQNATFK